MTSWAENDISRQELMTMQHDAVRRVREMQRQAMANLEKTKSTFAQNENTQYEYQPQTSPENLNTNEQAQANKDTQNQNKQQNKQNNNFANNNGYIGANQIFGRQPHPPNAPNFQNQQGKSPLGLLSGLFSKNSDSKGGISDLINGLIPKRDGNSPISKILDALDLDTEKLIIIVLIILLLNDGADYTLILALGYILL